jgi:hypothetical protein
MRAYCIAVAEHHGVAARVKRAEQCEPAGRSFPVILKHHSASMIVVRDYNYLTYIFQRFNVTLRLYSVTYSPERG